MSDFRFSNWRRWISALCVALAAFVLLERGFCSDPCQTSHSGSYNVALVDAGDASPSTGQTGVDKALVHHCCSVHAPATTAQRDAIVLDQAEIKLVGFIPGIDPFTNEQDGQERPPRISVLL